MLVTSTDNRARRLIAAGAFAVAAVAAPFAASVLGTTGVSEDLATPACLAWFGNKEDGHCLSYSNGAPVIGGMPSFQIGNNDPNGSRPGVGINTGPIAPGVTITEPIG
jgi:hypothetical protein